MKALHACALLAATILFGTPSAHAADTPKTLIKHAEEAASWMEREPRMLVRQGACLTVGADPNLSGLSPILEGMASSAISLGFDVLFNAIKKAGESKAVTKTALAPILLRSAIDSDQEPCFQVIGGDLQWSAPATASPASGAAAPGQEAAVVASLIRQELARQANIDGNVDFFWEGEVLTDDKADTTAFRIVTRALLIEKPLDAKRARAKGSDVVLTLAFTAPGTTSLTGESIKSTTSAVTFDFGRIKVPDQGRYLRLYPRAADAVAPTSPWIVIPKSSGKVENPRTLWAARTESTDGSAFFRTLSKLLEPHKEKIVQAANVAVIPSQREANSEKETLAEEGKVSAAVLAEAAALKSVRAYRDWWNARKAEGAAPPTYKREDGLPLYDKALTDQRIAARAAKEAELESPFEVDHVDATRARDFPEDGFYVREPPDSFATP